MEIIMKVTIPDSDVPTAVDRAPGPEGDLAEWIANFFDSNDRDYLRELGLGQMTVEVTDIY